MGNWKYYQLIATFYRALFGSVEQGVKINDAIHRVFEDFYFFPEKDNVISNMVIVIQYVEVLFSLDKNISIDLINLFNLHLKKVNEIKLGDYLDAEEIEHFNETIEEIKFKIEK